MILLWRFFDCGPRFMFLQLYSSNRGIKVRKWFWMIWSIREGVVDEKEVELEREGGSEREWFWKLTGVPSVKEATNENLPPNVIKQLAKELKNLDESPPESIKVVVNADDFSIIFPDIEGSGNGVF
ncbi:hypothetical protein Fmac_026639 [Flemingia macrophylla]|uniref:UBC core domain-containing protein n=1 Tax=Flemingia macrophylla TaxID=520843 RepID=A0ABD1LFF1_9FABA